MENRIDKHRFGVLDIFRGVFAGMVVFFHMAPFADTPLLNNSFVANADLFVDFFFVLSGFVIAYTYKSLQTAREMIAFYKKRFFRLYPLHIILLLVFVGVEVGKKLVEGQIAINQPDNPNNTILTFFSNLFFLHSIKLPGVTDVSWNIPSWSISAEMIAYIIFGALTFWISRKKFSSAKAGIYAFIGLLALATLYLVTGSLALTYSYDYGFLRAIAGFFVGASCLYSFAAVKQYVARMRDPLFSVLEVSVLVLMIVSVSLGGYGKKIGFIYEIIFFLAILTFSFEKGMVSKWLTKSFFLQRLGTYSYSVYMTHALLLSLFNILFIRVLHFPPSSYSYLFVLNFYLIYKVSGWTYRHIELRFKFTGRRA